MAKRNTEPTENQVARAASNRRKTAGSRASRKAQSEAPKPAIEWSGRPETDVASSDVELTPTNEEIAKRAYELYLRRGSRNGYDFDDWLEAERELRGRGTR